MSAKKRPAYEMRHIVTFEETNLVGNVYYANHIRWQGRCREMFLFDNAPSVLQDLRQGLAMITRHVFCEFYRELFPFDRILIQMRLLEVTQSDILLQFEYYRETPQGIELIARGEQKVSCMREHNGGLVPAPVPKDLREALRPYEVVTT